MKQTNEQLVEWLNDLENSYDARETHGKWQIRESNCQVIESADWDDPGIVAQMNSHDAQTVVDIMNAFPTLLALVRERCKTEK